MCICVCAHVHPYWTLILYDKCLNGYLMLLQKQWQTTNAVWMSGFSQLDFRNEAIVQLLIGWGLSGGWEKGQRVTVGVVGDTALHFGKNLLLCKNK